jgi:hypothetical protein
MGDVVQLRNIGNEDTIALARAILVGALSGDIVGLDIRLVTKDRRELINTSGACSPPYSANRAVAKKPRLQ